MNLDLKKTRVNATIHKDFWEMLKLESARNGQSLVKYTEELVKKQDPLSSLATDWKTRHLSKIKKVGKPTESLDFP